MTTVESLGGANPLEARERILDAAYALFASRGVRAVEVEEVVESAGVSRETLDHHYASKDELTLAFLERREQVWTRDWVEAEARGRGATSVEQLLSIFDLFDEWFRRDDFEGCSFVNALLEFGGRSAHPVAQASRDHLENIRRVVRTLAKEAGLRDPSEFALSWHILMKGSIVQAAEGDYDAAVRAKAMGRQLIELYR